MDLFACLFVLVPKDAVVLLLSEFFLFLAALRLWLSRTILCLECISLHVRLLDDRTEPALDSTHHCNSVIDGRNRLNGSLDRGAHLRPSEDSCVSNKHLDEVAGVGDPSATAIEDLLAPTKLGQDALTFVIPLLELLFQLSVHRLLQLSKLGRMEQYLFCDRLLTQNSLFLGRVIHVYLFI